MRKMLFSSMLVGALALPGLAFAAPDAPKPPYAEQAQGEAAKPVGPRHNAEGPQSHALRMAERLSAIETAIGIKTDQLDSWRAYTAALVGLMPEPPRDGPRPEAEEAPKDQILGERMADRMIEQAEKAKAFKEAAKNLREKLTPEQLSRLNSLAQEMRSEHKGEPKPPHAKPDRDHKPAHGPKHHANPDHSKPAHPDAKGPEGEQKPTPRP